MQENMQQNTFRYNMKQKKLRVEKFLDEMNKIIPWKDLCEEIEPYYKKGYNKESVENKGRNPHSLLKMLKIHFLQLWNDLSDPATEEAIYDRLSFQKFIGFDCFGGIVPDESSICRFRHILEENNLSKKLLERVNGYLMENEILVEKGTIVDAIIIQAPISKKNKDKSRDPEMTSTKKNNKWHFGSKGHIGVEAGGKRPIIKKTSYTTAKVADIKEIENLMTKTKNEKLIFGDKGYVSKKYKKQFRQDGLYYGIKERKARKHELSNSQKAKNKKHGSLRARVEHPFRIIKYLWGHNKLRYKGLKKMTVNLIDFARYVTCLCAEKSF